MTIAAGYTTNIYYKEESGAYGDIAGGEEYQYLGPIATAPFSVAIERANIAGLGTRKRESKPPIKHEAGFSIEVPLQLTTNWILAKDVDDTVLKLYSLAIKTVIGATTYYLYAHGVYLNEVGFGTAEFETINLKLAFDVQRWDGAYTSTQHTETYEARDTSTPQLWKDGKVEKVAASGWAATGDIDELSAWDLTIKNNYEKKTNFSNIYPRDSQEKGFDVNASITLDFETLDELTELLAENIGIIRFYIDSDKYIEVAGANYDSFDTDFAELELLEQSIPITGDSVTFV